MDEIIAIAVERASARGAFGQDIMVEELEEGSLEPEGIRVIEQSIALGVGIRTMIEECETRIRQGEMVERERKRGRERWNTIESLVG